MLLAPFLSYEPTVWYTTKTMMHSIDARATATEQLSLLRPLAYKIEHQSNAEG